MKINSELVKRLRQERHWSQEQLSEMCGLNLRTIQRLEKNGNASLESVRALAAVFEVDVASLELDAAEIKRNPWQTVYANLRNFDDFDGTADRYEFGWFLAMMVLVLAISTVIHPKAFQIAAIVLLLPFCAIGSRRLRDAGQSPWWQLMYFVPLGFVVPFVLLFCPEKRRGDETEISNSINGVN